MSKHLSQEQLLRHLDGELSRFTSWQTTAHLKSCWACQVELDHLKEEIASIVDAQSVVAGASMPPPLGPWPRLEPRLNRARLEAVPVWEKMRRFSGRSLRTQLVYGALLALAGIGLLLWVSVRPASAKEILTRVKTADSARFAITEGQVVRQRLRVQKTSGTASPTLVRMNSWKSATSTYWDSNDETSAELLARYKSYGLESVLPLSPTAVGTWIIAAGDEPNIIRDRDFIGVEVVANGEGRERGLQRVSLQIRADWHLEEMTLTFTDTTYEITEEEFSIVAREDLPHDVRAQLDPRSEANSSRVAASPPVVSPTLSPVNLDELEVEVRYELHQIGADLDEAIEIVPEPNHLRVEARNVSPELREKLATLMEGRQEVQLEFPSVVGSSTEAGTRRILPQTRSLPMRPDPRIVTVFGNAQAQESYTQSVLNTSNFLLTRLYALRELAEHWPANRERALSADSKVKLDTIVQDHAREVLKGTAELEDQLTSLLEHFGAPAAKPRLSGNEVSWREASNSGLDALRHVDKALRGLLTSSDSPLAIEQAIPQLQQSLSDLKQAAHQL